MTSWNAIVTGGAGFIGSHVAHELLRLGGEVVILDDLSGGYAENVPKGSDFVEGSINDTDLVNRLFESHSFTYVFHLAAYAAEGLSHFIRRYNYTNNVIGSVSLINAAVNNNCKCFVFTSSIAVYGTNQLPLQESTQPAPEDPYGIAKLAIEQDLAACKRLFDLDYIVFRPHNVYGENQNYGDPYRNVIGIFINKLMGGEAMPIFGDGEQTRAFTHVDDVAPIIAKSVFHYDAYGRIFNIGADKPYTVNELAKMISLQLGVDNNVVHLPAREEVVHAFSDHSLVKSVFDCEPKVDLHDGISRMVNWCLSAGPRKTKRFEKIEISKNLPTSWR